MITKDEFVDIFEKYLDRDYRNLDTVFSYGDYSRESVVYHFTDMSSSFWMDLNDNCFIKFLLYYDNITYFFKLPEGERALFRRVSKYFHNDGYSVREKYRNSEKEFIMDSLDYLDSLSTFREEYNLK